MDVYISQSNQQSIIDKRKRRTNNTTASPILAANYHENSTGQREIINTTLSYIRRAIDALDVSPSVSPFVIGDFGSAYGQNSIQVMKFIIQCLKQSQNINDEKHVLVVHNDLPTNNWLSLFESLSTDSSYIAIASGRSFYEQCLPKNSLVVGYSATSVHWLSRKPCNLHNRCIAGEGDENETALFRQQSREDLVAFLQHRSNELIDGGILILSIMITGTEKRAVQHVHGAFLYKWAQLYLTEEELLDFTIPFYFRTFDECVDSELFDRYSLQLISAERITARLPMFDQYQEGKLTVDELAKQAVGSMRAWSNPSLEQAMRNNGRTEQEISKVSEQIWTTAEEEIKNKPLELDVAPISTLLILKKTK